MTNTKPSPTYGLALASRACVTVSLVVSLIVFVRADAIEPWSLWFWLLLGFAAWNAYVGLLALINWRGWFGASG